MARTPKGEVISVSVDERSVRNIQQNLERMLAESRRQAPAIVKNLANKAANSAAKLTIPNTGDNTPRAGARSSVRRPRDKDKFRPLVKTQESKEFSKGDFYVVRRQNIRKKNKRRRRFSGFAGEQGERRVMRGSNGELVIYTTKPISQKDKRFKRITKLIKRWDKKRRKWTYIPTMSRGKYDKQGYGGKIPYFFAAKQAWLWSKKSISKSISRLNPHHRLKKLGRMDNGLSKKDSPSVVLHNQSEYAHKSRGTHVPAKALELALRGYKHELEVRRQAIIKKGKGG